MAEIKTKKNDASVKDFLNRVEPDQKREDSFRILEMMQSISGDNPKMWGATIVGFGSYHYKYGSGREGGWFLTGFSPRKQNLTLYIMPGFAHYPELMEKLGKHKTGKACLYINKLADVDETVLHDLIAQSIKYLKEKYS